MKHDLSEALVDAVRKEWHHAPTRGARKAIVAEACKRMEVNERTLYRRLELNHHTRTIQGEELSRVEEKNTLAMAVWKYRDARSVDSKTRTLRSAFRYLKRVGQLPDWFSEAMCYAAIERLHLANIAKEATLRFTPFERDHPRSMYQIDFTKSDYLKWNGKEIVMTDGRWSREEEMYVWIGAAIDDCSRCHYAEYILTAGENEGAVQRFLVNALNEKPGMMLLQGLPREIYVDRGPGFKPVTTENGLRSLGITRILGADHVGTRESNKQARGKIENLNKFIKTNFEPALQDDHGVGRKFSLAELNGLLQEWSELENQREHPTRKGQGIWNIWRDGVSDAKYPATDALSKFSRELSVKVSRRMIRTHKGVYFDAPPFLDEGLEVKISIRQDDVYVLWKGQEVKLVPHTKAKETSRQTVMLQALETAKETDVYSGPNLKDRFNTELIKITQGELTLATLPREYRDEIKPFFMDARTLAEIREAADRAKIMLVIGRKEEERAPAPQRSNILHWMPTNPEAARLSL